MKDIISIQPWRVTSFVVSSLVIDLEAIDKSCPIIIK